MKIFSTAALFVVFSLVCLASGQEEIREPEAQTVVVVPGNASHEYPCTELLGKKESFAKMRNGGTALLVCGGVCMVVGTALIASARGVTSYSYSSVTGEHGSLAGGIGSTMVALGIPFAVAGTVLTIIGARKTAEYNLKMTDLKCSLKVELHPNSVNLVCTF